MRGGIAAIVLLAGLAPVGLSPLSARANGPAAACAVVGSEKLPMKSGRSSVICAEVERAIAAQAPGVRYNIEINVLSPARLAATLIVNGRTLPVQNFSVMDGNLGQR